MAFSRADTSVLGRWWWTVDRWTLAALLALAQAVDWFGPKEPVYSVAVPATMLFAYALLAGAATWAGANRRPITTARA